MLEKLRNTKDQLLLIEFKISLISGRKQVSRGVEFVWNIRNHFIVYLVRGRDY